MRGRRRPTYDEGTTEERGKKNTHTSAAGGKERRTVRKTGRHRGERNDTMKNSTFDQIINANLASVDPGFGQFALAKASSDLFRKVLNK